MKPKEVLQLVLLAAIWGSSFLLIRMAAPPVGVRMTLSFRITIAALVLVALFAFLNGLPDYKRYWKQYLILGLLNLVLPFALINYSVTYLNASIGALLNATTPLFVMVLSAVWLKEKLTLRKISGLLVGLAGLAVLVGWIPLAFSGKVVVSLVASLLASLSYGTGAIYTRVAFGKSDPLQTATGQLSAAALLVLPLLLTSFDQEAFRPDILLALLLLAVVCTAWGYTLYFRLIARVGSANASLVSLLVPVFSLVWSVLFFREPVTPAVVIGLLLILGSLRLVTAAPR